MRYYNFFKSIDAYSFDCLIPDAYYGAIDENGKNLGRWLVELFDLWYADVSKPRIRLFDEIINIILGYQYAGNEVLGRGVNGVFDVKTNGAIQLVDALESIAYDIGCPQLDIFNDSLDKIFDNSTFQKYYYSHQDAVLCQKCQQCAIRDICGGGHLSHRFAINNGFANPSVYCKDLFLLISHIQSCLVNDFSTNLLAATHIDKINSKSK